MLYHQAGGGVDLPIIKACADIYPARTSNEVLFSVRAVACYDTAPASDRRAQIQRNSVCLPKRERALQKSNCATGSPPPLQLTIEMAIRANMQCIEQHERERERGQERCQTFAAEGAQRQRRRQQPQRAHKQTDCEDSGLDGQRARKQQERWMVVLRENE